MNDEPKSYKTIPIKLVDDDSIQSLGNKTKRVLGASTKLRMGHSGEIGFLHSIMCQTFLPCSKPLLSLRSWECVNGHSRMMVEAGAVFNTEDQAWTKMPLPYGIKARLCLIKMCTEAVRSKSPSFKLEKNMTRFFASILNRKLNSNDIKQLKIQMYAIGTASIRLKQDNFQSNSHFASMFDLTWLGQKCNKKVWPSEFTLSQEFWEGLKSKAVPLDLAAITAISHSALAIDIYLWLAQRLFRTKSPYTVYWVVLRRQFGPKYKRMCDFRENFLQALRLASAVYPFAMVGEAIDKHGRSMGIKLEKSPPPIPANSNLSTDDQP